MFSSLLIWWRLASKGYEFRYHSSRNARSYRTLRDGSHMARFPGTSCQATFSKSLRDKPPNAEHRTPTANRRAPSAERQTPNAKRLTHDPNCMRRFSPVKRLSLSGASPHQVTACSRTNHLSDCVGENHALPCGRSNVTIQFRRNGDPRLPSMIKSRARPRPSPLSPFAS